MAGPVTDIAISVGILASSASLMSSKPGSFTTVGKIIRCIFSSKECVINIRHTDFDDSALDALFTGEMTVRLKIDKTTYSNTGIWTQFNSGSGNWSKYRKNN
ncbi:MAG: hypothetical protein D3923_17035 [Candidatus Electrothrix sp. AR3]|nr:hypothetical protein [Candidatus Electrothrix sp. AR3]